MGQSMKKHVLLRVISIGADQPADPRNLTGAFFVAAQVGWCLKMVGDYMQLIFSRLILISTVLQIFRKANVGRRCASV